MSTEPDDPPHAIRLAAGRTLEIFGESEGPPSSFRLRAPSGELELCITVGPEGPRLRLRGADIEIGPVSEPGRRSDTRSVDSAHAPTVAKPAAWDQLADTIRSNQLRPQPDDREGHS